MPPRALADEQLDKPDEEDSGPASPIITQIQARVRIIKTVPAYDSVDIYWRLGGEGLGGESSGGRFERADTPEPSIDKPLTETPRGDWPTLKTFLTRCS